MTLAPRLSSTPQLNVAQILKEEVTPVSVDRFFREGICSSRKSPANCTGMTDRFLVSDLLVPHLKSCTQAKSLNASAAIDAPRVSKASRTKKACDQCAKSKASCNSQKPCVRCQERSLPCRYSRAGYQDPYEQFRLPQAQSQISHAQTQVSDSTLETPLYSSHSSDLIDTTLSNIWEASFNDLVASNIAMLETNTGTQRDLNPEGDDQNLNSALVPAIETTLSVDSWLLASNLDSQMWDDNLEPSLFNMIDQYNTDYLMDQCRPLLESSNYSCFASLVSAKNLTVTRCHGF